MRRRAIRPRIRTRRARGQRYASALTKRRRAGSRNRRRRQRIDRQRSVRRSRAALACHCYHDRMIARAQGGWIDREVGRIAARRIAVERPRIAEIRPAGRHGKLLLDGDDPDLSLASS